MMKNENQIDSSEYKITINNVNLTLKFIDMQNEDTLDEVMNILISSYQSRVIGQKVPDSYG